MKDKLEYELTLRDLFTKRMDEAIGKVDKLDKRMDSLSKKNKETGMSFMKLGKAIAGAFVVGKVVEFGKEVVDSLAKYQLFMASIKTMLGGNANIAEALNSQLVELAKATPFSLEDVREGSKQLLAYGFQAGSLTDNMRMLGDVSAGVGAPLGDIVYLYGTLRTQGRAFSKDIYQFTGRGIPIVRELAKQFKVTDDKVMDLAKDGKIGFAEIEKAFKNMTGAGGQFFNLMQDQSKTVGGLLSNYGDTWEQLRTNIGKSQSGIIANTVSWATKMVGIMNTYFEKSNFRYEATSKMSEGFKLSRWGLNDDSRDELPRAYRQGVYKTFKNESERKDFLYGKDLNKNKGWDEVAGMGSQQRFEAFSDSLLQKYNNLNALPRDKQIQALPVFTKELLNLHKEITGQREKNQISQNLAVNQFAVINELFNKSKGLAALNKVAPIKPEEKEKEIKKADLGTGIDTSMHRPQNLYISIDKLVESLSVNSTTVSEGIGKVKDMVAAALLEAVSDVNYIDGK